MNRYHQFMGEWKAKNEELARVWGISSSAEEFHKACIGLDLLDLIEEVPDNEKTRAWRAYKEEEERLWDSFLDVSYFNETIIELEGDRREFQKLLNGGGSV